jgi:hypothetical protein
MPEKFQKKKDAKTEKGGAAVKEEDEHLLSFFDVDNKEDVEYKLHNNTDAFKISCVDINNAFINAQSWKMARQKHYSQSNQDWRRTTSKTMRCQVTGVESILHFKH